MPARFSERDRVIEHLASDRRAAHTVLFADRRPLPSAPFHFEMIDAWHSVHPQVVTEGFRGCAKSTIGEEVVALRAVFRQFKNALIIGSSEQRAMERVESIQHELETNAYLAELFGPLRGSSWSAHKAELNSGTMIQALGVGQSLRGVKYHQWRPDFCWIDDIEDEESVRTPEARRERLLWLYNTLIPALEKDALVRMTGNRLDSDAVIATVAADDRWLAQRFPIQYRDERGIWCPSWPEKYDTQWIAERRAQHERIGDLDGWDREYMCEASIPVASRKFQPGFWRVSPRARTWEAVYAMYDPARSIGPKAATTGKAVWSWIGSRLVVWEGAAQRWLPSDIVADVFETDKRWRPIKIGVEEDGLNEWLMQPLRAEMVRRGHALPNLEAVKAPQGKDDFIGALEPFARAREIEFAFEDADLKAQFLNFPKPPKDFPNALAYALKLRPGLPIYDEFGETNIVEDMQPIPDKDVWLVLNAGAGHLTAALVQFSTAMRVLGDWAEEGEPGQVLQMILGDAHLLAGAAPLLVAPPQHFEHWTNVGLRQAAKTLGYELRKGTDWRRGREILRGYMRRRFHGRPCMLISNRARWTLNALAGGYCLPVAKGALLADRAEPGVYRMLMEGLESYVGLLATGMAEDRSDDLRYATARDGRRYVCAMPGRV